MDNYIIAKVEGQKPVLSGEELQQLLDASYDVKVLGYQRQ